MASRTSNQHCLPKSKATTVTLAAVLIAISVPIALSLYVTEREVRRTQNAIATTYARDVLARSEDIAGQVIRGFRMLQDQLGTTPDPCAPAHMAIMKRIDLESKYIQAVGRMSGDTLICSSLGNPGGIDLGPADHALPNGTLFRTSVTLPFAPDSSFLVVERWNYAAIIHKALPIDINIRTDGVSLATLTEVTEKILVNRGQIQPAWIASIQDDSEFVFRDKDHIVATMNSDLYSLIAMAAIPAAQLDVRTGQIAAVVIPVGIAAGILLAFAVLYLARSQMALPAVIKSALKRNEFFLVYQPLVDLGSGKWMGAEALIRWRRSNGEIVRPDMFIPVVENANLLEQLTDRVLDLIRADAIDLFRIHPDFHIAINLSSVDLVSREINHKLTELARNLGTRPDNFIVEATEREFLDVDHVNSVIQDLRRGGIRTAVDDFGTGYSSLSYLETFEFDYLKIDASFIETIGRDAATSHVVPHIIQMAKAFNLEMIAEGVETETQAAYLRANGVEYAQGYFFARPMSMRGMLRRLDHRAGDWP